MPFSERLLHFIWQFQHFNLTELLTHDGQPIQIVHPGYANSNQGPDFYDARIRIGRQLWAGTVELHINSSGWELHKHGQDPNYANVILHVVWEVDFIPNTIPVLELHNRIPHILLERFTTLMQAPATIPCGKLIKIVEPIIWNGWKERLVAERLLHKSAMIRQHLEKNENHWEETCWHMLARNFGMKVNADAFELIARSVPFRLLQHCRYEADILEALLFGQSGLLHRKFREVYPKKLLHTYQFLQRKYGLQPMSVPIHFLRMRPANFPTIRLAQLSALLNQQDHLFAFVRDADKISDIQEKFIVTASQYWNTHYRFDEKSEWFPKKTGAGLINNVLINTIVPLLFAYGDYYQTNRYKEKSIDWLIALKAESNSITRLYSGLDIVIGNAFDSQAMVQLYNFYCKEKRCLDCRIGARIIS